MGTATLRRDALGSRLVSTDTADWRDRAACADHDPALFHPHSPAETEAALAICATCPVVTECLAWADQTGDDWAVLGATTREQRRAQRWARLHQRLCQRCRAPFWTRRARYCSDGCRQQAAHAMRSTTRPREDTR